MCLFLFLCCTQGCHLHAGFLSTVVVCSLVGSCSNRYFCRGVCCKSYSDILPMSDSWDFDQILDQVLNSELILWRVGSWGLLDGATSIVCEVAMNLHGLWPWKVGHFQKQKSRHRIFLSVQREHGLASPRVCLRPLWHCMTINLCWFIHYFWNGFFYQQ